MDEPILKAIDVVALGGNAILPPDGAGTFEQQAKVTRTAMRQIAALIAVGRRVVITHGNGPIVGNIVVRNERAKDIIPPMPLDVCGADSQGGIGYMMQQSLQNVLRRLGDHRSVVSVVTQVLVDIDDPAFDRPVKPIGPYYEEGEAKHLESDLGWTFTRQRDGYRRVVPSPRPIQIVEGRVIAQLAGSGNVVITLGGGGIPVVRKDNQLRGVEAVVDKDLSSALLANELLAERLIILTNVDAVYKNFGGDDAEPLFDVSLEEIKNLHRAGQFPAGSMGAKIEAAIQFLEAGGRSVIIARPGDLKDAAYGKKGTTIRREKVYAD